MYPQSEFHALTGIEALAFARQRVLEELEEKRRSQREQERGSAALCFSGAALVVILLL